MILVFDRGTICAKICSAEFIVTCWLLLSDTVLNNDLFPCIIRCLSAKSSSISRDFSICEVLGV